MDKILKLKKVYVEITNSCNLSCSFCKINDRPVEFITPSKFSEILDKISENTSYIYFHVLGEPLLHENIGTLLDLCYKKGFKAMITSNSTLIGERGKELINKHALRQVNYSLQSLAENNLNNESVLDNIFNFIDKTPSIYHCLRLWTYGFEDHNIISYIQDRFKVSIPKELTSGNGYKIKDNLFIQLQNKFIWPCIGNEEVFIKGSCKALKHDCGILIDGSVVPCCLDGNGAVVLGNIYEQDSLDKILKSQRSIKIKDGFSNNIVVERFCRTCGFGQKNS